MLRRPVRVSTLTLRQLFSVYARYTHDSETGTETSDIVESRVFTDVDVVFSCFCFVRYALYFLSSKQALLRPSFTNLSMYHIDVSFTRTNISLLQLSTIINRFSLILSFLLFKLKVFARIFTTRSFSSQIPILTPVLLKRFSPLHEQFPSNLFLLS